MMRLLLLVFVTALFIVSTKIAIAQNTNEASRYELWTSNTNNGTFIAVTRAGDDTMVAAAGGAKINALSLTPKDAALEKMKFLRADLKTHMSARQAEKIGNFDDSGSKIKTLRAKITDGKNNESRMVVTRYNVDGVEVEEILPDSDGAEEERVTHQIEILNTNHEDVPDGAAEPEQTAVEATENREIRVVELNDGASKFEIIARPDFTADQGAEQLLLMSGASAVDAARFIDLQPGLSNEEKSSMKELLGL